MTTDPQTKPTKVGFSTNIPKRVKAAQTYHHKEILTPYIFKCKNRYRAKWLEKLVHRDMDYMRIRGEWFDCNAATAIRIIKEVADRYKEMSCEEIKNDLKTALKCGE